MHMFADAGSRAGVPVCCQSAVCSLCLACVFARRHRTQSHITHDHTTQRIIIILLST
jgi:hypothetical protein